MKSGFPSFAGIIWAGEKRVGTGFLIVPQERLLVTARHVIDDHRIEESSQALSNFSFQPFGRPERFRIKSELASKPREKEDVVLLELAEPVPSGIEQPELIPNVMPGSDVWLVGYVQEKQLQREYKSAQGKLSGLTAWNEVTLYELDIDGIYHGMSGSPVMLGNHGVVGILTDRVKEYGNVVALVTPIELLATLDSRIETPRDRYLKNLISKLEKASATESLAGKSSDYVPIPVDAEVSSPTDQEGKHQTTYPSIFAISQLPQKLMLLGAAGSGKTTALMQIAIKSAKTALENLDAPIPVFLDLWKWIGDGAFLNFLSEQFKTSDMPHFLLKNQDLATLVASGDVFLILDGLEEITDTNVRYFKDWLGSSTDIRCVISCRKNDYIGNRDLGIPLLHLRELQEKQIAVFVQQCLSPSQADKFFHYLFEAGIKPGEKQSLLELAKSPFFLVLSLENFRTYSTQPNQFSAWLLLSTAIRRIWESDRIQVMLAERNLKDQFGKVEEICTLLSEVAFNLTNSNESQKYSADRLVSKRLLTVLQEATFLQEIDGNLRFFHSFVQNFFAAYKLKHLSLKDYLIQSNWSEAILLFASSGEEKRLEIESLLFDLKETNLIYERLFYFLIAEIGDAEALEKLLLENTRESLIAIGTIAGRLPSDSAKDRAFQFVREILFQPIPENSGSFDRTQFDASMAVWSAAEAISYFRDSVAAETLLTAFEQQYDDFDIVIQQPFSHNIPMLFARIGKEAIPALLRASKSAKWHVCVAASEALASMYHGLVFDLKELLDILAEHPSPTVRGNLVRTMSKMDASIISPYLEALLCDSGILQRGKKSELFKVPVRYFYVADVAAAALSETGSPEVPALLAQYGYNADGSPSHKQLVQRLTDSHDVDWEMSLCTWWAQRLIITPEGLSSALRCLGHLGVELNEGFHRIDPVARAFIKNYDIPFERVYGYFGDLTEADLIARSEAVLSEYFSETLPVLKAHLESAEDTMSRQWVLYILGNILRGPQYERIFLKYLDNSAATPITAAAAFSYGIWASKSLVQFEDMSVAVHRLLALLGDTRAEVYHGVGMGLAFLAGKCSKAPFNELLGLIVGKLLNGLKSAKQDLVLKSLDALENIYISIASIEQSMELLLEPHVPKQSSFDLPIINKLVNAIKDSPSYYKKVGDFYYSAAQYNASWDIVIVCYDKALARIQNEQQNQHYSSVCWKTLHCCEENILFALGNVWQAMGEAQQAASYFSQALELLEDAIETDDSRFLLKAHCLHQIGVLSCYIFMNPEAGLIAGMQLLAMARGIQATTLEISAIKLIQHSFGVLGQNERCIEAGYDGIELAQKAHLADEEVILRFNTALALERLGDRERSLAHLEAGLDLCRKNAVNNSNYPGYLEQISRIQFIMKRIDADEYISKLNLVKLIYQVRASWESVGSLLCQVADIKYRETDPAEAIVEYMKAREYYDRVETFQHPDQMAIYLNNLAGLNEHIERYSEAEECYQQALSILEQLENPIALAQVLSNYGDLLRVRGNIKQAAKYLATAHSIQQRFGLKDDLYSTQVAISKMERGDWGFSLFEVEMLLGSAINVLTIRPEAIYNLLSDLEQLIKETREKGQQNEMLLGLALKDVILGEAGHLEDNNPYFGRFQEFVQEVETLEGIDYIRKFSFLFLKTITALREQPGLRWECLQQIGSMMFEAVIAHQPQLATKLIGLGESLRGTSLEEAYNRYDDQEILRIMSLIQAAIGESDIDN